MTSCPLVFKSCRRFLVHVLLPAISFPSTALCEELGGSPWRGGHCWSRSLPAAPTPLPRIHFLGKCSFLHWGRPPLGLLYHDKGELLLQMAGTPVYPHANVMAPSLVVCPRSNPLSTQCRRRTHRTNGIHVTNLLCVTSWGLCFLLTEEAQEPLHRIGLQPDTSSYFCLNPYGASLLLVF